MLHWTFFPSSSTSMLDIFHVVSSLILVFIEKNWLRLCTSNSRSKWVTERHCTEKQRFINWSLALVIAPLQRNKQGEKCMGTPGWLQKVKFPVQRGHWSIAASHLNHTWNCMGWEMWQPVPSLTTSFPSSCQQLGWPGSSALALHCCSHKMWWKAITIHCPGSRGIML